MSWVSYFMLRHVHTSFTMLLDLIVRNRCCKVLHHKHYVHFYVPHQATSTVYFIFITKYMHSRKFSPLLCLYVASSYLPFRVPPIQSLTVLGPNSINIHLYTLAKVMLVLSVDVLKPTRCSPYCRDDGYIKMIRLRVRNATMWINSIYIVAWLPIVATIFLTVVSNCGNVEYWTGRHHVLVVHSSVNLKSK